LYNADNTFKNSTYGAIGDYTYTPNKPIKYQIRSLTDATAVVIYNNPDVPSPLPVNSTVVLNDSTKTIKYSEYPVMFILKLYLNGIHIETLLTKD